MIKIGECYFRKEDGSLWLAESFLDEVTQEATSTETLVEPAPEPVPEG
jgi:hypothetical protein